MTNGYVSGLIVLAAVVAVIVVWRATRRRVWCFPAGVRHNLQRLTERLDGLGCSYEVSKMIDAGRWMDGATSSGAGALALSPWKRWHEAAVVWVTTTQSASLDGHEVVIERMVTLKGHNRPRARVTMALSPFHCWGFDPYALTYWERDPRVSQVEYHQYGVRPCNIPSQTLPDRIIETAARYLAEPVPLNRIALYRDAPEDED
jgi:hypothetical protein